MARLRRKRLGATDVLMGLGALAIASVLSAQVLTSIRETTAREILATVAPLLAINGRDPATYLSCIAPDVHPGCDTVMSPETPRLVAVSPVIEIGSHLPRHLSSRRDLIDQVRAGGLVWWYDLGQPFRARSGDLAVLVPFPNGLKQGQMSIAIVRQAMPPIDATGMLLLGCIWCVVLAGAIAIVKRGRLPLQFDDKAMAIPSVGERPDNISSYPARASEIIAQIGADIHDGPMQTLNALALMIATQGNDKTSDDHAAQLALSARIAEELRMISQGLVAPDVPSGPVHAILSAAIRHHESDTGQPVAFSLRGLNGDLTATRSHALYRIIREALQNAYRHGDATPAHVWAVGSGKRCRVTVSNSGAYKPDTGGGHLGHKTMEMRAQALGGTLRVISGIRTGTRLRVTFDA